LSTGAITIALITFLVLLSWQTVYSANRDLVRARAWGDLTRRTLPFGALLIMASSLFVVQSYRENWMMIAWMVVSGAAIVLASLFSVSTLERQASRAFRGGEYERSAELYRELARERPLARHHAFLGAALGASERFEESVQASTAAIKEDPLYGLAYYNRALVLHKTGRRGRALKDLKKALEADLPRRFRSNVRKMLEELS
jgi:tetratricopeptide (TPR) repeat protein